ncbi:unnamed protein product [marine sediment metagenome]|uniref:Uncharacterized protein n=1 Tax=marine sediment metagenome TaxID=412755 RepID=X1GP11_9ZZZZ
MDVGNDFFKWMAFIIRLIRVFIEIFGNDAEKESAKNNHIEV